MNTTSRENRENAAFKILGFDYTKLKRYNFLYFQKTLGTVQN